MASRRLRREDYSVGWICALPIELAAAQVMLDEEHESLDRDVDDTNIYTLGRIGEHNVVIACLPAGQMGTNSAAAVAIQIKSTFKSIRFSLMIGIGGGVPSAYTDIRLGDVIVSQPHNGHGGVIQYDFGKTTSGGFVPIGFLNTPPTILLNAVSKIQANHLIGKGSLSKYISELDNLAVFARDNAGPDILFEANYDHVGGPTCDLCSKHRIIEPQPRKSQEIIVHYGTIASGNQVMRDASTRDRISLELGGVLCFEMEAAGLMNSFPCLVIRGICDYADSHKNKKWQGYAAATAAAYAKEILSVIPAAEVVITPTIDETIKRKNGHIALPVISPPRATPEDSNADSRESYLVITTDTQQPVSRPWRILSLDGGGVKGLAELRILERLFRTIKVEQERKGISMEELPLPCEYFDLIGGTSTGGLVAIMLGRLRMSIPQAIHHFKALCEEVFRGDKSFSITKFLKGAAGKAYFDGKHMEMAVKKLLMDEFHETPDLSFREVPDPACKVFVCATRAPNGHTTLLRSYQTIDPGEPDYILEVWEAARATSSAPLFFDPFAIERRGLKLTLVDGALRLNNPVNEIISEAYRIHAGRKIGCLVSVGTGVADVKALEKKKIKMHQIVQTCVDISINCNDVAQDFARSPTGKKLSSTNRFFRFDVERQVDEVDLEDWRRLDDIEAYVDAYLRKQTTSSAMALCADRLINPRVLRKSNLPSDPNPDYQESITQMRHLDSLMARNSRAFVSDNLHVRDVGAPELAFRYAQRQQSASDVYWLRADKTRYFEEDLNEIAKQVAPDMTLSLRVQEKLERVQRLLEDPDIGQWLLVVVNPNENRSPSRSPPNPLRSLSGYLPQSEKGRILVVSNNGSTPFDSLRSDSNTYELGPTQHFSFSTGAQVPMKHTGGIGSGGISMVDLVQITKSLGRFQSIGEKFARKRRSLEKPQDRIEFLSEVEVLKHIRHIHIVRIVLSYEVTGISSPRREGGFLMTPIADRDLARLLCGNDINIKSLKLNWLGCLSSALRYLHSRRLVHGDIKPSNLLIKGRDIYLTDFGCSRMLNDDVAEDELIPVSGYTPSYAAPEVRNEGLCYRGSDVFSLGLVFMEIITVWLQMPYRDIQRYLQVRGPLFHKSSLHADRALRWLIHIQRQINAPKLNFLEPFMQCIFWMLQPDRCYRTTADEVWRLICRMEEWRRGERYTCPCLEDAIGELCDTAGSGAERNSEGQRRQDSLFPSVEFPRIPAWQALSDDYPISWKLANQTWIVSGL